MAIKKVNNLSEYAAKPKSSTETTLTGVTDGNELRVDGINVRVGTPVLGDAVYADANGYYFYKGGDRLNHTLLAAAGLTAVGPVCGFLDGKAVVMNGTEADRKYADVLQYTITAITSTTPTINLRFRDTSKSGDAQYASNIPVAPTLTSTDINATTAAEISAAVAAKAAEVGDTQAWWAYLADADGNKVDEGGTCIIIQCDVWSNYQQYSVSGSGLTVSFTTWGDMPANNWYKKLNGQTTNYRGLMNIARGAAYWSTNGRVPTTDIAVGSEASNTDPVKREEFNTSAFCTAIRNNYKTYEAYLHGEFGIPYPQKWGCFGLPHAKELTLKYALKTAPTKNGGNKYKYPALYYAYSTTYGIDGLDFGDWYLQGVHEGVQFMDDANIAVINRTLSKMGKSTISNGTSRWFAQRYTVSNAWLFGGTNGTLNHNTDVNGAFRARALALLKFKS
jgi:hypothetical protein